MDLIVFSILKDILLEISFKKKKLAWCKTVNTPLPKRSITNSFELERINSETWALSLLKGIGNYFTLDFYQDDLYVKIYWEEFFDIRLKKIVF